jgi:hypothetical protein
LLAFFDFFLLLGAGLGELAFNGEFSREPRILPARYCELASEGDFLARSLSSNGFASQLDCLSSRSRFQADACQRVPRLARGIEAEGEFVAEPGSAQRCQPRRSFDLKQYRASIDQPRGLGSHGPVRG